MDLEIKISKDKSCNDWISLKNKLQNDYSNSKLWEIAFDLLMDRINSRYLDQVELIKSKKSFDGEGFSMVTILCCLIEFLESTVQGLKYRYCKDKELNKFEYNKSKELFIKFLTDRKPFQLENDTAVEVYENVRCGLIHEAQTKNNWIIRSDTSKLIEENGNKKVLNRNILEKKIKQFLYLYSNNLITDRVLQNAFIRKLDFLCQLKAND